MNFASFYHPLLSPDRNRLSQCLKNKKSDFRIGLLVSVTIVLVAPYLTLRVGQKPLIENLAYGKAVLFMAVPMIILLVADYIRGLHKAVNASRSDLKRIIIVQIRDKEERPLFRSQSCRFDTWNKEYPDFYLPRHLFHHFQPDDWVRLELSHLNGYPIRVAKTTPSIADHLMKNSVSEDSAVIQPYMQVLMDRKTGESIRKTFSVLIPSDSYIWTPVLLYINILVFVIMAMAGVDVNNPTVEDIIKWGGNARVLTIDQHQYWRLITCNFVHLGVDHLFMNHIGFLFAASFLEKILGHTRFIIVYMIAGICGALTSAFWNTFTLGIGASGAIFGLYGVFLALLVFVKKEERKYNSVLIVSIIIYVGYNLLTGLTGNIDNACHIGGLLSGFIMGAIITARRNHRIR